MSTIRHETAQAWLDQGGALECVGCGERWIGIDGEPTCPDCGSEGFVARAQKVEDRFPDGIGRWLALPAALMEHGAALGLTAHERIVVIALESHRRQADHVVFPSIERVAMLTGLGPATVKRTLKTLADRQLLEVTRMKRANGRWGRNEYYLWPLWCALRDCERGKTPTKDQGDLWTGDQSDPSTGDQSDPGSRRSDEEEAVEGKLASPAHAERGTAPLSDLLSTMFGSAA